MSDQTQTIVIWNIKEETSHYNLTYEQLTANKFVKNVFQFEKIPIKILHVCKR